MLTYISALLSGSADPFWPHFVLITGSVLAGIAVGAGIIFESAEYSLSIRRAAKWLVIGGVTVESVCTVCLFVFDEGTSRAQQSKIIALEARIALRSLSIYAQKRISSKLEAFNGTPYDLSITPEAELSFVNEIMHVLDDAQWDHRAFGGFGMKAEDLKVHDGTEHAGIVAAVFGVVALYDSGNISLRAPAESLASALMAEGIIAKAAGVAKIDDPTKSPIRTDAIHIEIGNRR